MAAPLIIGIGQPWRGDDAAGLAVLDLLDDLEAMPHHGEGLALMALWEAREAVILIDAACSGAPPGTLHRLEGAALLGAAGAGLRASSHVFGVQAAARTAQALGRLPRRLVVHAVEGVDWGLGRPLTPAVAAALPPLAARVRAEAAWLAGAGSGGDRGMEGNGMGEAP